MQMLETWLYKLSCYVELNYFVIILNQMSKIKNGHYRKPLRDANFLSVYIYVYVFVRMCSVGC